MTRSATTSPEAGSIAGLGKDRHPAPLRLVQITDLHLFAGPESSLLGLTTRSSFEAVLEDALGDPTFTRTDALVMTGDLVHDESREGYVYLRDRLASTGLPCYCIPGNHDRPELLTQCLGEAAMGRLDSRALGNWNLIFLDSTLPGEDGGQLKHDQMEGVNRLLEENPSPTLVFLHQQPVPVGSAWMDTMDVANGQELVEMCDRHPNVRALVFGHIHQEFALGRGHYQILGAPSTCVQFLPGSEEFAIDTSPPGYRELLLHPDGRLETSIRRLAAYPEPLVTDSRGY